MIPENQVEPIAIHWFQGTGWNDARGVAIAPAGVPADREDFRAAAWRRDAWMGPAFVRQALEEVVA